MGFFENSLVGKQIDSVHVDSELTYIMLSDGTQVSIRGLVVVEPGRVSCIRGCQHPGRGAAVAFPKSKNA